MGFFFNVFFASQDHNYLNVSLKKTIDNSCSVLASKGDPSVPWYIFVTHFSCVRLMHKLYVHYGVSETFYTTISNIFCFKVITEIYTFFSTLMVWLFPWLEQLCQNSTSFFRLAIPKKALFNAYTSLPSIHINSSGKLN